MDEQEQELLEGFHKLCPTARNTVLTAVSLAVAAEDAVRHEIGCCGSSPAGAEVKVKSDQIAVSA